MACRGRVLAPDTTERRFPASFDSGCCHRKRDRQRTIRTSSQAVRFRTGGPAVFHEAATVERGSSLHGTPDKDSRRALGARGRAAANHVGVVRGNKAVRFVKAPAFGDGIGEEGAQGIAGQRLSVSADQGHVQLSCGQHRDETLASGRLLHGDTGRRPEPEHLAGAARTGALDIPLRLAGIHSKIVFEDSPGPEGRGLNVLGNAYPLVGEVARAIDPGVRVAREIRVEECPPRKYRDRRDVGALTPCDQVGAKGHLADVEFPGRQLPAHRLW